MRRITAQRIARSLATGRASSAARPITLSVSAQVRLAKRTPCVCVGSGASGEANSVQIGSQTTGTGVGSTFVGFNITGGTSGNAVIIGANSTSNNAVNLVAVGEGISGANSCVLIGRATSTAGTGTTALGNAATDTAVGGFGVAVGYLAQSAGGVTLGAQATSVATSSTSIGRQATGTGAGSTLIGKSTSDAGFAHVVAIGRLSTATKANQFVMGANGTEIVEVVIGEGAASASPQSQLLFTTTNGVGYRAASARGQAQLPT